MKRTLILLTAAAVAMVPAVDASAAKAKAKPKPKPTKRVVTWDYQGVGGVTNPGFSASFCAIEAACYELSTLTYEKKVAVNAGGKVALQYWADDDYNGTVQTICGEVAIPVSKGTTLNFAIVLDPACQGVPTQGKVTMTITGLK